MTQLKTATQIHAELLCRPGLHSAPELHDDFIVWQLYPDAYVQAFCDGCSAQIEIVSNSLYRGTLLHLRSSPEELAEELYALGKQGNLLILKQSLLGARLFYLGPADQAPPADLGILHFGKKKWDSGTILRLEQT